MVKIAIPLNTELLEEYPSEVTIEKATTDSGEVTYRVNTPKSGTGAHRTPIFDEEKMARLWADVWFDVGGFYEEGTGNRGVPPAVATANTDTTIAYLVTQHGVAELAEHYDIERTTIYSYLSRVRKRARETRSNDGASSE